MRPPLGLSPSLSYSPVPKSSFVEPTDYTPMGVYSNSYGSAQWDPPARRFQTLSHVPRKGFEMYIKITAIRETRQNRIDSQLNPDVQSDNNYI